MLDAAQQEIYSFLLGRLQSELQVLPDKPDETPEATLICLWALASGAPISVNQSRTYNCPHLSAAQIDNLNTLIDKRLTGTPLAHLTGRQDFMNIVMLASPDALVPRKETEILGRAAVALLAKASSTVPLVIDVCTGAGNIALGIASMCREARVFGADLSPEAIELARKNASFLGRKDVEFRCGDLLDPFRSAEFVGQVDVLCCNPPYISSGRVEQLPEEISLHEPKLAFDGGPFGIGLIRRLIKEAPEFLREEGWLVFEIGLGQGPAVARSLEKDRRFDRVNTHNDNDGQVRVVEARRAPI